MKPLLVVVTACCTLSACHRTAVDVERAAVVRERPDSILGARRFVDSTLIVTLWRIPVEAPGAEFDVPFLMHAAEKGLLVWDATRLRLTALDLGGSVRWRVGQAGGGPEEFRQVRDMEPMGDGSIALLDNGNRRLTIVDRSGAVRRSIAIQGVGASDQFFAGIAEFVFFPTAPMETRGVVVVDTSGRVVDSLQLPLPSLAALDPLVRQILTIESDRSPYRVVALKLGDGFWVQQVSAGSRGGYIEGWYREHQDFPAMIRQQATDGRSVVRLAPTPLSAVGGAVEGDELFLLFAGATANAGRIVDVYTAHSAAYRCSFLLPEPSNSIEFQGGRLYSIVASGDGGIMAYDMRRVLGAC